MSRLGPQRPRLLRLRGGQGHAQRRAAQLYSRSIPRHSLRRRIGRGVICQAGNAPTGVAASRSRPSNRVCVNGGLCIVSPRKGSTIIDTPGETLPLPLVRNGDNVIARNRSILAKCIGQPSAVRLRLPPVDSNNGLIWLVVSRIAPIEWLKAGARHVGSVAKDVLHTELASLQLGPEISLNPRRRGLL